MSSRPTKTLAIAWRISGSSCAPFASPCRRGGGSRWRSEPAGQEGSPALEAERGHGGPPAVARSAHDEVGVRAHAVEEDLAEVGASRHLDDRADLDARLVHRDEQHRDALVLGQGRIGAHQHEDPVRVLRRTRSRSSGRRSATSRRRGRPGSSGWRGPSRRRARRSPGTSTRSPERIFGRKRCCWASEPMAMSVGPSRPSEKKLLRTGASARAYSWAKISSSMMVASRPPKALGQERPVQPPRPSSCSQAAAHRPVQGPEGAARSQRREVTDEVLLEPASNLGSEGLVLL